MLTVNLSQESKQQADLDSRVLARGPLDACACGLLQDWVILIITDHVVRLDQLLVAEEGVVTELKHHLESLQM